MFKYKYKENLVRQGYDDWWADLEYDPGEGPEHVEEWYECFKADYLGGIEDMKKQMTTYPKNMAIDTLLGKSLTSIEGDVGTKKITFQTANNETYELSHDQDCREEVCVVDISGDLQDLIKHPILLAEEIISANSVPDEIKYIDQDKYLYGDSFTWTFYKLATIKGSVTIRWLGTSNGYYSESVDFVRIS